MQKLASDLELDSDLARGRRGFCLLARGAVRCLILGVNDLKIMMTQQNFGFALPLPYHHYTVLPFVSAIIVLCSDARHVDFKDKQIIVHRCPVDYICAIHVEVRIM